jgi:uncharacterized membrane protein (DUF106 family)
MTALLALILLAIQFETWKVRIISGYYMWLAPTWLLWYLLAVRSADSHQSAPELAAAHS